LSEARARGLDQVLETASAAELKALADAARLSRQPADARRTLWVLRERFPQTTEATRALFDLGRLAADHGHDAAEAARWFRAYLQSAPAGALRMEARGRLLLALDGLGAHHEASSEASLYLAEHPDGPHAELARSLVRRSR
jgi:hypothetical protein